MLSVVTTARSMIAAKCAPVDWFVNWQCHRPLLGVLLEIGDGQDR